MRDFWSILVFLIWFDLIYKGLIWSYTRKNTGSNPINHLNNNGENFWLCKFRDTDVNHNGFYLFNKNPINTFYNTILIILIGGRYL